MKPQLTLNDLKAVTRTFGGIFTVDDMFDIAQRVEDRREAEWHQQFGGAAA